MKQRKVKPHHCTTCGETNPEKFTQKYKSMCRLCRNKAAKVYRTTETIPFIRRCFDHITRRCDGQTNSWTNYTNIPYCDRDLFVERTLADPAFQKQFKIYRDDFIKNSTDNKSLRPSPDRIDNSKGYYPDNLEWKSYGEHMKQAAKERAAKVRANNKKKKQEDALN